MPVLLLIRASVKNEPEHSTGRHLHSCEILQTFPLPRDSGCDDVLDVSCRNTRLLLFGRGEFHTRVRNGMNPDGT